MKKYLFLSIVWFAFTQCEVGEKSESKSVNTAPISNDTINEDALIQNNIELFKVTQNAFPDAILEINSPNDLSVIDENKEVNFNFNVVNFKFENGSHIALYTPAIGIERLSKAEYAAKFKKGKYASLAFLCDEQGLSVKQPEAYGIRNFAVGSKMKAEDLSDSAIVALNIYSKSTSSNPLIDFYLANANISKAGNRILLNIDETEFNLHNWSAYSVNGLKKGKHKIKIQLVDKFGNLSKSPFAQDSTEIEVK